VQECSANAAMVVALWLTGSTLDAEGQCLRSLLGCKALRMLHMNCSMPDTQKALPATDMRWLGLQEQEAETRLVSLAARRSVCHGAGILDASAHACVAPQHMWNYSSLSAHHGTFITAFQPQGTKCQCSACNAVR
jgi:hypothetical protein